MNDSDNHYQPKKPKVIDPLPGQSSDDDNKAVELIRSKIDSLYAEQNKPQPQAVKHASPQTAKSASPQDDKPRTIHTKHQKFMYDLRKSGKSLAEIQTAWYEYYVNLPDEEKHHVWKEFYDQHNKSGVNYQPQPTQQPKPAKPTAQPDTRSSSEIKQQLINKIQKRAKPKNPHLQSMLFGLGMGTIVVAILLFSFFNERIIAPFITPSRAVSSTPIISDINGTSVGKDPKIIIPKINVEIPVVYDEPSVEEDKVQKALERGVLHYATTPNPGEKGNAAIFGHSSNNILNRGKYKFAFVLLNRLENGDTFMLEKDGKRYVYKVFDKKVVSPKDLSVLNNHGDKSTVTLITCDPPGTTINRLVVVGEQISPNPSTNVASSVENKTPTQVEILPSNSPTLWQRFTSFFSS